MKEKKSSVLTLAGQFVGIVRIIWRVRTNVEEVLFNDRFSIAKVRWNNNIYIFVKTHYRIQNVRRYKDK